MLISAIQNNSLSSSVKARKSANVQNSIQKANELQSDSFSREKVDAVSFKGQGKAAAGTVLGGFAGLALLASAPLTLGIAPLIAAGLMAAGAVGGGLMKDSDDKNKN